MSGEILFIAHRIPFPPNRGDKVRSHHIVKRLAKLAPVHIACFADDDADFAEEVELAALARSYCLIRRTKPLVLAGLQALAKGQPVSVTAFDDQRIADYVHKLVATGRIGTIYVYSGQVGHFIPADFKGRVVVDFVDVDSAKFAAYAKDKGDLLGWIDAREARLLRAEEARLAARADVSLLVSREETQLFEDRLTVAERRHADVRPLLNGIDSDFFDPALVDPEPRMADCGAPRLVFTGQMDYAPNQAAAMRAVRRIMPLVRRALPQASLHVVGRNPTADLLAHHGKDGIHVWGRVDDIRTWIKGAQIALVPLEIARGIQNKVLEAMAMELPVVLTAQAATGIDAVPGQHFRVADSDEAIAAAVIELARAPADATAMGLAARRFVVERQSWTGTLAPLADIIHGDAAAARDAA
ncbi:MAG: TIGR03087 family PEP-CTERM/XrtA system glycosyltransferase [Sphingomonadales bacterium]|nr:TIGR03087 family PEP-CTERM/XrtA system glycosyltransferase [Sphingomonadales bacterium]